MRVLQLSQRLRLVAFDRRYFEDYGPVREAELLRQKDARKGASAELMAQPKFEDLVPNARQRQLQAARTIGFGRAGRGERFQQRVMLQKAGE